MTRTYSFFEFDRPVGSCRRLFMLLSLVLLLNPLRPAAAAQGEIPLDAFATLGTFEQIEMSPEGGYLAYLYPVQGQRVVLIHPTRDASKPLALPKPKEGFVKWFRWANEERLLVSYAFSDADGNELTRLFSFRRDGKRSVRPVPMDCVKEVGSKLNKNCIEPFDQDNVIDWLEDDKQHILVSVDSNRDGAPEVWRANVKTGSTSRVRDDALDITRWITDQEHQVRLGLGRRLASDGETPLVAMYRRPNGEWADVSSASWVSQDIVPVRVEADPRYAIAVGSIEDTQAILRLDLVEDEVTQVLHHDPLYDLYPRFHDDQLIGYLVLAQERLEFTDRSWLKLGKAIGSAFPDDPVQFVDWTDDLQLIILMRTSDRDAGTYFVWDRKASKVYELGRRYADLPPERMAPMQQLTYEASDGLQISAYLTLPQGVALQALPTVVMPHGGPWSRDTWGFDFLVQMIANRGYAVFQPNFRGSVYQGRAFEEAGKGQWGRKMQKDLSDGLQHLVDQGISDPERVCLVGWSYGGYAALMGAIQEPERYRCAASINGLTDLKRFRGEYSWSRRALRYVDGLVGVDGSNVAEFSPVARAQEITIPILLVHAKDDGRVDYEHSRVMARRLNRAGVEHDLVTVARGDHSLMHEEGRLAMLTALEQFLARHLRPTLRAAQ